LRNNVRVVGTGKTTLVLAHGFGTDQRAWHHQEAALTGQHRLILFDHVGAGSSDVSAYSPHRYRSLHSYADDLLEILAELDVENVLYIGHSMSGMIGLLAALLCPARFSRMIFINASPRYLNDGDYHGGFEQREIDEMIAAMVGNYQLWASGFAGLMAGNPERPELVQSFTATLAATRPDIAVAVMRLLFQSDHRAELSRLEIPTLILQSSHDIAVPRQVGEYLTQKIPNATLRMLDARGHLPHMSVPDAVLDAISSFLF
jgi:sigma-B regulation protein RsbQ